MPPTPATRPAPGSYDADVTSVIAFDVNETLLDLRALDEPFGRVFGDESLRAQWFAQMLQLSFVGTIINQYVDFTTAQHAALEMLAARRGIALDASAAASVVGAMRTLPAYPEVREALLRLRGADRFAVAALTNSPEDVAVAQVRNAGLADCFDKVVSADSVRRLKPAREPYEEVARQFGVGTGDVCLVAAHAWDISGALAAGCRAAFVRRPGMEASPIGPQPDIVATDIGAVVDQLLADA